MKWNTTQEDNNSTMIISQNSSAPNKNNYPSIKNLLKDKNNI